MAETSHIEWTDATWNPITGCSVVTPGCTNCYAMKLAGGRLRNHPSRAGLTIATKAGPVWTGEVRLNEEWLDQPLRWGRPRRIFVCAHGDLFHESVPDEWIDRVFAVMALAPQHVFQVLTKRAKRMKTYVVDWHRRRQESLARDLGGLPGKTDDLLAMADLRDERLHISNIAAGFANVWLGVSVEDQQRANERIPDLLETPAAVRFLSCEPLLGPLDLTWIEFPNDRGGMECWDALDLHDPEDEPLPKHSVDGTIDWVICGGESGPGARPMHPDWARSLRDQCATAHVPFFFKQWGEWAPGECAQHTLDMPSVETACWFNDHWAFETIAGDFEFHVDDEPTLYRAGKKAAGRLLDGVTHDRMPPASAGAGL
jgi:protein gp37